MPKAHALEQPRNLQTITAALEVAARQYRNDAQTNQDDPRIRAQFTQQAIRAQTLHDWIAEEYST